MQTEILYMANLDVGATLVSPTVAEAGFGRSKDRPYDSAQASLISVIHHSPIEKGFGKWRLFRYNMIP